jgi:AraC-like DNA-binding protein
MIVAYITDPYLQNVVANAASPEEDVIFDPRLASDAVEWGYPRIVVHSGTPDRPWVGLPSGIATLSLDSRVLSRWESSRRGMEIPPPRTAYLTERLRTALDDVRGDGNRVDRTLAELSRAAGTQLPLSLRAFGRRVLEFPSYYVDLHAMAEACGLSRGALKARFRRKGLVSPYTYLRWFRMIAVADVISDRGVTVSMAATQLGFTSDGNLCRTMVRLTGLTPSEVRTLRGWNRLLIGFAWRHLTAEAIQGWTDLEELFLRRVA